MLFSISTAQLNNNTKMISLDSSISPSTNNSYWLSNSGQFAFGFYKQGNGFAIGIWFDKIKEKTVIWTANRDQQQPLPQSTTLVLNDFANFVSPDQPAASASMLDSGNFVLYNSDSEAIWQSFENPTDTLLSGQILETGKELVSAVSESNHSSGEFQLTMQTDGNLVLYPAIKDHLDYHAYWGTGTYWKGSPKITLSLRPNGQLELLNSTSKASVYTLHPANWIHPMNHVTFRLTIDVDGILRLYSHSLVQVNSSWNVEWNSTNNRCDPTGLCGMNAYCVLDQNQQPNCTCLPGHDFIDQSQKRLGCERKSKIDYCTTNQYTVSLVEFDKVLWENNSYSIVPKNNRIDCEQDCLNDCQCEIAMYKSTTCKKLRLPLRYAKADQRNSNVVTMVKVLNQNSEALYFGVTKGRSERVRNRFFISSVLCIVFSFIFLLLSMFLCCRSNFHSHRIVYKESNTQILKVDEVLTVRSFTFNELEIATNFFMEPLGKGSFGTVFKGTLRFPDGERAIAVKRLEKVAVEGEVEFLNEMRSIGRTHHKNLTKPHWNDRVKIALGIARGILYLHEDCENKIIHCDINPNNILIDENRDAKIADFGLAKLLMPDQTRTHTGIRGTRGFVALEWHKGQPITTKADVYSFGIVLLVIICCRPGVDDNLPEKEAILVDWVYECFMNNNSTSLMIDEEVNEEEFDRLLKIGLWCTQEEPTIRPPMKKVVAMLEGTLAIPIPPCIVSCNDSSSYFLDIVHA
ncbi:hypothetical protein G4B88_027653 [Cannabis sativa]|uniref:Receptor-like serine/threonine-protein kinase n=1 Tax=Cannabis sativa TaxID=3483 RepID=A0A7J6G1Z5_CANSA|nr:hypothetical protein G4B88_027653 [Cannabis sativa]